MASNDKSRNYNIILVLLAIIFFPITIIYLFCKILPEPTNNNSKSNKNNDDIDWETECEICGEQDEDCECHK